MSHIGSAQKIMIVEDEDFLRSILATKLKNEGYVIVEVTDGEEALKLLKNNKPDLILLDLMMPKLNGFAVLEHVKSERNLKKIPVIILSNLGQQNDIEKGKELGAVDYIIKSNVSINEVVQKVKDTLFANS